MRRRNRGFSLLEILVAFVILALSMGVIMRLFSSGTQQISLAERHAGAAMVAESVLAGLGTEMPLTVGELSGEGGRDYHWRAQVSDHLPADQGQGVPTSRVRLFQIDLEVGWGEAGDTRNGLRYTTLKAVSTP